MNAYYIILKTTIVRDDVHGRERDFNEKTGVEENFNFISSCMIMIIRQKVTKIKPYT